MTRAPTLPIAFAVLLAPLAIGLFAPGHASADLREGLFQGTITFEQAYLGEAQLDGPSDLAVRSRGTLGASLRLELLITRFVGLGVEGNASYFRIRDDDLFNDGRHLIVGTNGFLRLRFALANGLGEYYFIGGGGPAFMDHDENAPNQYGRSTPGAPYVRGASDMGWAAYARFGWRGELVPGFGALVEFGWVHREHRSNFEGGTVGMPPVATLGYTTNQMSIVLGWYVAR